MRLCCHYSSGEPRSKAFTLVELMVAMTVLAIIGALLFQIVSATTLTTTLSNRNVDAASQTRVVFDRMQTDLSKMVRRPEADFLAGNSLSPTSPPRPLLQFFSALPSPGISPSANNRGLSLVSYEVRAHGDNVDASKSKRLCLTRAALPVPWNTGGYSLDGRPWAPKAVFMGLKGNGLPVRMDDTAAQSPDAFFPEALRPDGGDSSVDFDVLAPGVIRMAIGFQLYADGGKVSLASSPDGQIDSMGQVVYSPPIRKLKPNDGGADVAYIDVDRIAALIVGVVAVDSETLRLLSAKNVSDIAAVFPLPEDQTLPVQTWFSIARNPASFDSSIPLPARQSVRVYQRAFPVTPFGQKGLQP